MGDMNIDLIALFIVYCLKQIKYNLITLTLMARKPKKKPPGL